MSAELSPVKRALLELRDMRARLEQMEGRQNEPIAVVGMSCRLPGGVDSAEGFWELLQAGRDAIREVPADRWDLERWFNADPDAPGKMYTRHGGFLDAVDRFDAAFFGITPREAERMDPQQRLLLEVSWAALEDAAIVPSAIAAQTPGVFVGMSAGDYLQLQLQQGDPRRSIAYIGVGQALQQSPLGGWPTCLGWQGPAVAVDTACSSSLVAVHLACQSLRAGECGLALAGGVSLILIARAERQFLEGADDGARRPVQDVRCRGRRLRARRRAAASWC